MLDIDDALSEYPTDVSSLVSKPKNATSVDKAFFETYSNRVFHHAKTSEYSGAANRQGAESQLTVWKNEIFDDHEPHPLSDITSLPENFIIDLEYQQRDELSQEQHKEQAKEQTEAHQQQPNIIQAIHSGSSLRLLCKEALEKYSDLCPADEGSLVCLLSNSSPNEFWQKIQNLLNTTNDQCLDDHNTPCLMIGSIQWHDDQEAPLLICPISLTLNDQQQDVTITPLTQTLRVNPYLNDKLERDLKLNCSEIVHSLSEKNSAFTVSGLIDALKTHEKSQPEWLINETLYMGLLPIKKYQLWANLNNNANKVKEHAFIRLLFEDKTDNVHQPSLRNIVSPKLLDQQYQRRDWLLPTITDVHQRCAVLAAQEKRNFILNCPSGTAKNNTITNIIANQLAHKRRVLWVSNQSLAQKTLFHSLKNAKLDPYCLKVNTQTRQAARLLQDLQLELNNKTLGSSQAHNSSLNEWLTLASEFDEKQVQLQRQLQALNTSYPIGFSLYQAIGYLLRYQTVDEVALTLPEPKQQTREQFEKTKELIQTLEQRKNALAPSYFQNSALLHIKESVWSEAWQKNLIHTATVFQSKASQLAQVQQQLEAKIETGFSVSTYSQFKSYLNIIKACLYHSKLPIQFAFESHAQTVIEQLKKASVHVTSFHTAWTQLSTGYKETVFDLELNQLQSLWLQSQDKWFIGKWNTQRTIAHRLKQHTTYSLVPSPKQDLHFLCEAKFHKDCIHSLDDKALLQTALGVHWKEHLSQPQVLVDTLDIAVKLIESMQQLLTSQREKLKIQAQIPDINHKLQTDKDAHELATRFLLLFSDIEKQLVSLDILTKNHSGQIFQDQPFVDIANDLTQGWIQYQDALPQWCAWIETSKAVDKMGFDSFIKWARTQENRLDKNAEDIATVFEVNYLRAWLKHHLENHPVLQTKDDQNPENLWEICRQLDDTLTAQSPFLIQEKIHHHLRENMLSPETKAQIDAIKENACADSILDWSSLFNQYLETVLTLKPCWMASPDDVSELPSSETPWFDLVIIDEASLINTSEALSSIALGEHCIVVGDIQTISIDSYTRSEHHSTESLSTTTPRHLLEDAHENQVETISLHWLAEKKHHDINKATHLMNNKHHLFHLPSYQGKLPGLTWHFISNNKENENNNANEACQLIDSFLSYLDHPEYQHSVGIMAFTEPQTILLKNLLNEKLEQFPELKQRIHPEELILDATKSPAGDTRKVMFLSMALSIPTTKTTESLSSVFQPFTAAKLHHLLATATHTIHVFSSIQPESLIDYITNTPALRGFMYFLDMAQRSASSSFLAPHLSSFPILPKMKHEVLNLNFEQYIYNALQEKGWEIQAIKYSQSAGMDFGVINPKKTFPFLSRHCL